MPAFVTITFDLATGRTTVAEEGRPTWTALEPDGIVGACRLGSLYSRCGSSVSYRIRRSRPAVSPDAARVAS